MRRVAPFQESPVNETTKPSPSHTIPRFILRQLNVPPIGPNEDADEFRSLFEELLRSEHGVDRSGTECIIAFQATTLTFRLIALERIAQAMIPHKRPEAILALLRRTGESGGAEPGSLAFWATSDQRIKYVGSKEARKQFDVQFAAAGYGASAIEIEAFELALPLLAKIHAQINAAQKQLMAFLKDLERRDFKRAATLRTTALGAISRARSEAADNREAN
jgi:hypothetical protein